MFVKENFMCNRNILAILITAAASSLACNSVAQAQTASIPDSVESALEENARSLNPITVEWVRTRTSELPVGSVLAKIKYEATAIDVLEPEEVRLSWKTGAFRCFYRRHMARLLEPTPGTVVLDEKNRIQILEQDVSSDGRKFFNASPNAMIPLMGIYDVSKLAKTTPRRPLFKPDYMTSAGFSLPNLAREFTKDAPARSLILRMIREGARVERVEPGDDPTGTSCLVITLSSPDRTTEFFLDPKLHYALRRRVERSPSGQLATELTCSDFVGVEGTALSLPKTIRVEWSTWVTIAKTYFKTPLIHESFKVSRISHAPSPDSEFVLPYNKAGSYISDETVGKAPVQYRVPANPEDLDAAIKNASGSNGKSGSRSNYLVKFAGLNVVLVAILAAVRLRRHWAQHKAARS